MWGLIEADSTRLLPRYRPGSSEKEVTHRHSAHESGEVSRQAGGKNVTGITDSYGTQVDCEHVEGGLGGAHQGARQQPHEGVRPVGLERAGHDSEGPATRKRTHEGHGECLAGNPDGRCQRLDGADQRLQGTRCPEHLDRHEYRDQERRDAHRQLLLFGSQDGRARGQLLQHDVADVNAALVGAFDNVLENYENSVGLKFENAGYSIEGREIKLIRIGSGPINVLAWSQMHGDESTATMALLDLLKFFTIENDKFSDVKKFIIENVSFYFIPMLNPDGAENYTRQNEMDIDLNRDASRLQFPESKILKSVQESIKPIFSFNLHDQSTRYTVGDSYKVATIAFLAPAFNYEKDFSGYPNSASCSFPADLCIRWLIRQ